MPLRTRLLLVACFIASNNPERMDMRLLTDSQSGRRKKERQGTDSSAADSGAIATEATGGGGGGMSSVSASAARSVLPPRVFSLERLLSVFTALTAQTKADRKTPQTYGDPALYSTVSVQHRMVLLHGRFAL